MNKLVVIGCIGMKKAYLNISVDEAMKRFLASESAIPGDYDPQVIEFEDELDVYEVWGGNS